MSGEQQAAFAAVYQRHHRALLSYCRSIVGHDQDAQDALQSTMASALKALDHKPLDFDPQPWLFKIAHNEAISILRRRRPTTELAADIVQLDEVHARVEAHETLRLLRQDLEDLPERQRTALLLRELHGLATVQIAGILGTTPGAVNQLILEARRALSRCAEGRATPCYDVQRAFSDGDGRVTRARKVRAHLRSCPSCQRFRADLERRPRSLAALAPTLPGVLTGGGASAPITAGLAAKVAVAVLVTATAATGVRELRHPHRVVPPAPVRTAVAAPTRVVSPGARAAAPAARPAARPSAPAAARPRLRSGVGAAPRPHRTSGRREAVARTAPVVAPAAARADTGAGQATAPGNVIEPAPDRTKKAPGAGRTTAPERTKKATGGGRTTAPGQTKKATGAGRTTAPGQVKKATGAGRTTAPGQTKKATGGGRATAPGQTKKAATGGARATAPGQDNKQSPAPPATPPGQAKKTGQPPAAAAPGRRSPPSDATSSAS